MLSPFDEAVSAPTKRDIVPAMIPTESDESDEDDDEDKDPPKRVELKSSMIPQLESFPTRMSIRFLKHLDINSDFLNADPEVWEENASFKEGLKKVKHLTVMNNVAERGAKLIEEFNG